MKMKFNEEEVTKLKKMYSYLGYVDENGVSWSSHQGFGYGGVYKNEDGNIVRYWSVPASVDPDNGSIGYYDTGKIVYSTVDDLINGKEKKD